MVKNSLLDPALDNAHINAAIARHGQGKKNKSNIALCAKHVLDLTSVSFEYVH